MTESCPSPGFNHICFSDSIHGILCSSDGTSLSTLCYIQIISVPEVIFHSWCDACMELSNWGVILVKNAQAWSFAQCHSLALTWQIDNLFIITSSSFPEHWLLFISNIVYYNKKASQTARLLFGGITYFWIFPEMNDNTTLQYLCKTTYLHT